jgi:hypothetical protein
VAREGGIVSRAPVVLADAHNTIVWLVPSPVVAKVATSPVGQAANRLTREIAIAEHVASRGGPVARPSPLFEPRLYTSGPLAMTFWEHVEHEPAAELDPRLAAAALGAVHEALLNFKGDLPDYADRLREAGALLADVVATPTLPADDRSFMRRAHAVLSDRLSAIGAPSQPLHGEPHRGNILVTKEHVLLVDLEAACRGPREWDAGFLPDDARAHVSGLDHELLNLLAPVRSLCVAAACWAQPGRHPDVTKAAKLHLRLLKESQALG